MKKVLLVVALLAMVGCTSRTIKPTQDAAPQVWKDNGFTVLAQTGYEYGIFGTTGGCAWYLVEHAGQQYTGCVAKFNDEYRIYAIQAVR